MVFTAELIGPGIIKKIGRRAKQNQPPMNKIAVIFDIKIIFPYSAKKNKAKPIAAYSTLYPETSSASASGKSKGCRFVSAKIEIKNKIKTGNKGFHRKTSACSSIIFEKFNEPATIKIDNIIEAKETS